MKNENSCSNSGEDCLRNELGVLDEIEESKAKYLKIVHAGIAKWVKDFQDGRIEIKTVDDLWKLIEIDMELQQGSLLNSHRRARAAKTNIS